ncbi:SDR family NAD(P)-dependent oxidoreductase [Novosphingobium sp.]|uniref:SDR family NAD(P)-dependent oxidoreductase n=1 Tax=Novosphingobium sp. TaxID=1874826 RepID=UPI003D0CC915
MGERTIIVTGGFGALGRVVAQAFAAQGDHVVRVDFAPTAPDVMTGGVDMGGVDLTDAAAVDTLIGTVTKQTGGIDVLVNIAGGFTWETVADGSPAAWHKMHAMNVITAVTITRAALPALKSAKAGRVINIGAGAALQAAAGMGAYAASKAGVHRFTEALAAELAGSAITVNAVLPSTIDTPANRADMPDADTSTWVTPRAIADVITYLASPAARAISGALIPVAHGSPD